MQKKQWVVFVCVVIAFGSFAYKYFDQAIPFIKVPISMSYDQACQKALSIVEQNSWNFKEHHVVAEYTDSTMLQAFVELEGGGKQAFIEMIEKDYFQPYAWHVRFFKEKEISELIMAFTPDGRAYEFAMKLPETFCGESLSKEQALELALKKAVDWNVNFDGYDLVESNQEELPSGRIDYTFVYQRHDVCLNKGLYRIKLKVSGDVFSEMQRSVKIPDEFNRRYEQMFSLNRTIASFARNVGFILYFFIFGLFIFIVFFCRKNGFLWKPTFKILGFFLVLFMLTVMNEWSQIWNCYPTHISMIGFIIQRMVAIMGNMIFLLILIGLSMLLAESAGRLMFQKHIQFFKLWNRSVLATHQVLTQTLLGYGCAVILLGYAVGFALWSQTLGWWVPLSNLMDPNILATKIPAWCPIVNAFRAGFMEEFLCRALPLAGIALLAQNSKRKAYWMTAIFIVQIIIFGALHANYPQQPAYYRIVELIFHSTVFGLLYIYFGLLPGIVAHFVFDAFLMLLPVFVSTLLVQKILGILMMLIPLILVFIAWVLQGYRLKNVAIEDVNESLEVDSLDLKAVNVKRRMADSISGRAQCAGYLFGLVGLLLWSQSVDFDIQTSKILLSISQVETKARQTIAQYFGPLDDTWKISREYMSPKDSLGSKFIWQTFGNDVYQKLQGTYLLPPAYNIKFTKFEGPVEDRSEIFEMVIQADGVVARLKHAHPEFWAGADLSEEQAQFLAYDWISKMYHIDQVDTQIISSQSVKHENRRDWNIVVKDIKNYSYEQGQARIQVLLCGDQLGQIMRFVHPTEQWQRSEQSRMTHDQLLKLILTVLSLSFCAMLAALAIARFGISTSYFAPFVMMTLGFIILGFAVLGNSWFEILSSFNSSEPLSYQLFNLIGNSFVKILLKGSMFSIMIFSAVFFGYKTRIKNLMTALPLGVALGLGVFGFVMFCQNFEPMIVPNGACNGYSISISSVFDFFSAFISNTMTSVMVMMAVFAVSEKFVRYAWLQMLIFAFAGIVISGSAQLLDISVWIISGILLGLLWYYVCKFFLSRDSDLIWIIMLTGQIMQVIPSALYGSYPGIVMHIALSSIAAMIFVSFVYKKI